jgi:hypothetical protein
MVSITRELRLGHGARSGHLAGVVKYCLLPSWQAAIRSCVARLPVPASPCSIIIALLCQSRLGATWTSAGRGNSGIAAEPCAVVLVCVAAVA